MVSNLRYIQEQLRTYTQREWHGISKSSGVSFGAIKHIVYGETSNPRVDTVQKLYECLRSKERRKAA